MKKINKHMIFFSALLLILVGCAKDEDIVENDHLLQDDQLLKPVENKRRAQGKFLLKKWANKQGGFWDRQKWMAGDFNGDGKQDFAKVYNDQGKATISVHVSNGEAFSMQRWASLQGGFWDAQQWVVGDFDGDGNDDMAKTFNYGGYIYIDVHLSDGEKFYTIQRWANRQGGYSNSQKWLAGDFNGDGVDDIAKVYNYHNLATIDVHVSNKRGFEMRRYANRQGGFSNDQQWVAGDFNGDGVDDLAKAFNDSYRTSIDVHLSSKNSFNMSRWATKDGGFSIHNKWVVGDFNGDGKEDMANAFNENNSISVDVYESLLNQIPGLFTMKRWVTTQSGYARSQQWGSGDFNGDGKDDLVKVTNDSHRATIDTHLAR